MIEETILAQQIFDAKWVANGFPKSGTHLLAQLVQPVAPYQEATEVGAFKKPWSGTFVDNSWTLRWAPIEQTCFKLARVNNGRLLKTHLGFIPELERWMYLSGIIHVFIYRDLRDVAVSQAYHIIDSKPGHLVHPAPEDYRALGGFSEVLSAVITGLGRFPSLIHRWEYFAPWLSVDWVLSVRFEDLRTEPKLWAERIFKHAMRRSGQTFQRTIAFDPIGLNALTNVMAKVSEQREKSPTFRKGNIGDWREEFTEDHIALWKEHDQEHWLDRLGYEEAEWYD